MVLTVRSNEIFGFGRWKVRRKSRDGILMNKPLINFKKLFGKEWKDFQNAQRMLRVAKTLFLA